VKTSLLGTAFFKIPLPAETPEGRGTLDSQWALLDQSMERARVLGTDKIRVFAFTYKDKNEKSNEKDFARILELVREAARRAKARNFRLALETHYQSPQGKAHATRTSLTALLKVIEQV